MAVDYPTALHHLLAEQGGIRVTASTSFCVNLNNSGHRCRNPRSGSRVISCIIAVPPDLFFDSFCGSNPGTWGSRLKTILQGGWAISGAWCLNNPSTVLSRNDVGAPTANFSCTSCLGAPMGSVFAFKSKMAWSCWIGYAVSALSVTREGQWVGY